MLLGIKSPLRHCGGQVLNPPIRAEVTMLLFRGYVANLLFRGLFPVGRLAGEAVLPAIRWERWFMLQLLPEVAATTALTPVQHLPIHITKSLVWHSILWYPTCSSEMGSH